MKKMNKFVNRNTEFPNRKILDVKSVIRNDIGEIKEIHVEEMRDEGQIYQEGTPLNAEVMNQIIQEVAKEEVRQKIEENNDAVEQTIHIEKENIVKNIIPQMIREERDKIFQLFFTNEQIIELDKSKIGVPTTAYFNFRLPEEGVLGTTFEWKVQSGTGITIKDGIAVVERTRADQRVTLTLTATNKEEVVEEEILVFVPAIQYATDYKESTETFSILADGSSTSISSITTQIEENSCVVIENEYDDLFEVQTSIDRDNILTISVFVGANLVDCGISEFCFTVRVDDQTTGLTHQIIHGIVECIESIYPAD